MLYTRLEGLQLKVYLQKTVNTFLKQNEHCLCLLDFETIALSVSIDQQITNSSDPSTLNFFHVSSDGDIMVKTELDILMTLNEYKELHQPARNSRRRRKARTWGDGGRWWHNAVNYKYVGDIVNKRDFIRSGMDHWEKYTCLKFHEKPSAWFRLDIEYGDGCASVLGRHDIAQPLYLADYCMSFRVVVHELGHAIGMEHEQSRPERDTYITVHWDNIPKYAHGMFSKPTLNTYNITYDYTSIMHYGSYGNWITTKDPSYQNRIGQTIGLSFKDIKLANLMYSCSSQHCPDKECPFHGFVFFKSFKDQPECECWCDSGNLNDPLVFCSSIDKEVPEPNLQGASTLPATNVSRCIDMLQNCMYLKEQGLCRTEMIVMFKMCPKTCDFCGKGSNLCMDLEDGCGMMAASGACQQGGLREMMSQLCPKSCGLCAAISAPCDIEFSLMEPSNPINRGVSKRIGWITVLTLMVVASGFFMEMHMYI